MFRPGWIQPRHGERSKTKMYRVAYAAFGWLYPLFKLFRGMVTTSDTVARAMVKVAKEGAPKPILETRDINALGAPAA
jgi:hypothetical protein